MTRHRLRSTRTLGALVLACALVATACGSDDGGTQEGGSTAAPAPSVADDTSAASSSPAGTEAPAGAPAVDEDAVVDIAYAGPMNSLDPHKATITVFPVYDYPIYDRLFEVDFTQTVVPMVAKEWSFAEDGSSLEVVMRDDVVFHDGTPVDAAAVKASIERGKTLADSTVTTLLKGITAVEVVDDYTVRFQLDGVGAELPSLLATNVGAIMNPAVFNDPSVDLDTAPPPAAGSGPYVVTSSEPNVSTSYERAPEYWDPTAGLMAGFSVTFVPQGATRLAGLQAGDFDLVQVTGDVFQSAVSDSEAGRFQLFQVPAATRDLYLNSERGDLANPEIRRAISMGIDREAIGEIQSCLPNTQPYQEAHWAHNPAITNPEFDPETAAQIIEDAGGASIEIVFAAGSSYEPVATVLQSQLSEIGMDVSLRPVEQAQTTPLFSAGEVDSIVSSVSPAPDPIVTLNNFFTGGQNIARGPIVDEINALAAQGADPSLTQEERAPIYQEVFKLIMDNNLYVTICQSIQGWAHNEDLVGLEDAPGITLGIPVFTRLGVAAS